MISQQYAVWLAIPMYKLTIPKCTLFYECLQLLILRRFGFISIHAVCPILAMPSNKALQMSFDLEGNENVGNEWLCSPYFKRSKFIVLKHRFCFT